MTLRKGQRVQELTKKVGQIPRRGTVLAVSGDTVEVEWDDGHRSIVTHGLLIPEKKTEGASR